MFNADKMLKSIVSKTNDVVYDFVSGSTAIKTSEGLVIYANGKLSANPFDSFAMELPAFAMLTKVEDIKEGDIIVLDNKAAGFVHGVHTDEIGVIRTDGQDTIYQPREVLMFGQSSGIKIVKSLFNMGGNMDTNSMLPMLMMMSGKKDMKSMLPLLMMQGGNTSFNNPLMLMAMMGEDNFF